MKRFSHLACLCAFAYPSCLTYAVSLMDQIGGPSSMTVFGDPVGKDSSGIFQTLDCEALDDFSMPSNLSFIDRIDVHVRTIAKTPFPTTSIIAWQVNVYTSPINGTLLVSAIVSSVTTVVNYSANPIQGKNNALVQIPIQFFLAPGNYWISATPIMSNGAPSLTVTSSSYAGFPCGNNSVWSNPGNGYGSGTSVNTNINYAYLVDGI